MALGRMHDKFNLLLGAVLIGLLIGLQFPSSLIGAFASGWLLSTFIFSPDLDLGPKKRAGFLRVFLYPYSLLFKHRGLSHHLLFGTLTRVIYVLLVVALGIYVLHQMGHLSFGTENYWWALKTYLTHYNYALWEYKLLTWFLVGLFLADMCHILLDRTSSFLRKIFRF